MRGSRPGRSTLRTKLLADVVDLQRRVKTIELEPAQVANGSVELLGEVSKSKITGEEERYSHIDLVDFEANVEGAKAAFDSVRTRSLAAATRRSRRRSTSASRTSTTALGRTARGNGFVSYTALTTADTRALSRAIDALAEPLSQVGAIVVAGQ